MPILCISEDEVVLLLKRMILSKVSVLLNIIEQRLSMRVDDDGQQRVVLPMRMAVCMLLSKISHDSLLRLQGMNEHSIPLASILYLPILLSIPLVGHD